MKFLVKYIDKIGCMKAQQIQPTGKLQNKIKSFIKRSSDQFVPP